MKKCGTFYKGAVRKVTLLNTWISLKASECSGLYKIKTAGFTISEEVVMLAGLGEEYKSLIMSLEIKDGLTLDYVKHILLNSVEYDENRSEVSKKFNKKSKKRGKCYEDRIIKTNSPN